MKRPPIEATYNGVRVLICDWCQGQPKMRLRCPEIVTPEFAAAMNDWMVAFFGRETNKMYTMPDPKNPAQDVIFMCQDDFDELTITTP